jgi:hypothetical protein
LLNSRDETKKFWTILAYLDILEVLYHHWRHPMSKDKVLRLIRSHKKELDSFNVKSLALFGSAARDESHALSDIDILVEFKDKATFDQYMKLKFFLEDTLGCPVDLVTRKALKPRLRDSVEREALRVT